MEARLLPPNNNRALIKHVHTPDNTGFTHTDGTRFTYFAGSKAGARDTFGMSCSELSITFDKCVTPYIQDANNPPELVARVRELNERLKSYALHNKEDINYRDPEAIASGIVESGHIPLILAAGLPAADYQRAARSIKTRDIVEYFREVLTARTQAREYLNKQDMMKCIANLRKKLQQDRDNMNTSEPLYYSHNRLINLLATVIKKNQDSMPKEYEQFDLCETFIKRIATILRSMDRKMPNPADNIANQWFDLLQFVHTFELQEIISNGIYGILEVFFKTHLDITKSTKELELTEEQYAMLQNVLPLLAYLNSEYNPFARNGLFGAMVENAFHKEAVEQYRSHETHMDLSTRELKLDTTPSTPSMEEFDEDQINHLIFGVELPKQSSLTFFSRMLQGPSGGQSQSAQRRLQLTLKTPEVLLLEGPKANGPRP